MGGTSSDVALVEPRGSIGEGSMLAGLPLHLPSVEVHTVGCGGGSIAYVDAGGALRVGPQVLERIRDPRAMGAETKPR